jgi:P27 family predicted phage terminase small subunit
MRGKKPVIPPLGVVDLPAATSRVPEPPAHLQGLQRDCWNEVARVLVAKNVYDKDCEMMLAAFCVQYARFLTADEKVKERGLIILNKKGAGMHNPYVGISNSAYDRAVRLASELGLTPVSRTRVVKAHRSVARTGAMKFLKSV